MLSCAEVIRDKPLNTKAKIYMICIITVIIIIRIVSNYSVYLKVGQLI